MKETVMTEQKNYTSYRGPRRTSFKDDADKRQHQQTILVLTATTAVASLACFALLKQNKVLSVDLASMYTKCAGVIEDYNVLNDCYLSLAERYIREVVPHVVDVAS